MTPTTRAASRWGRPSAARRPGVVRWPHCSLPGGARRSRLSRRSCSPPAEAPMTRTTVPSTPRCPSSTSLRPPARARSSPGTYRISMRPRARSWRWRTVWVRERRSRTGRRRVARDRVAAARRGGASLAQPGPVPVDRIVIDEGRFRQPVLWDLDADGVRDLVLTTDWVHRRSIWRRGHWGPGR